ncbi:MAG: DUF4118 domain-containing protein [Candidatus Izimaplasma sp.]|nr:DUF4118 domain-containing protein [Candidatus Izimaplasma bacterium]
MKHNMYNFFKDYSRVFIILILSILLSFSFEAFSFGYENILLLFIVAVVLVIMETKSYGYGILATVVYVLFFNFFFTEPKYTLQIEEPRYIMTLGIFLVVSFLIASLMQKLHVQAEKATEGERTTNVLYQIAKSLLSIRNMPYINKYFSEVIKANTHIENFVYMDGNIYSKSGKEFELDVYQEDIEYAIKTKRHIGLQTSYKPKLKYRFIGIADIINHQCAFILHPKREITSKEYNFINTIINLYKIVMQKEVAQEDEENSRITIENEKFKNQLLRSISHDLRTPLTRILTGTSLLLEENTLDESVTQNVLEDIVDEVDQMRILLDNILQMTKFQNQEVTLKKTKESIDDLTSQAISIVKRRLKKHQLHVHRSKDVIVLSLDQKLFLQVIVNLLDNAITHTDENSIINIKYHIENNHLIYILSDNGGGIKASTLEHIFDSDYASETSQKNHHGFGLGLGICKAIIEKHGGKIKAFNNDDGGATFTLRIPL